MPKVELRVTRKWIFDKEQDVLDSKPPQFPSPEHAPKRQGDDENRYPLSSLTPSDRPPIFYMHED
jgi:hypothetical protein